MGIINKKTLALSATVLFHWINTVSQQHLQTLHFTARRSWRKNSAIPAWNGLLTKCISHILPNHYLVLYLKLKTWLFHEKLGRRFIANKLKYTPNWASKSTIKLSVALSHVFIWFRIKATAIFLIKFYMNQRSFNLTTYDTLKIQKKTFWKTMSLYLA